MKRYIKSSETSTNVDSKFRQYIELLKDPQYDETLASSVNYDNGVASFWINDDYNTYTLVIQDDDQYDEDTYMFNHPKYWGDEELKDCNEEKLTADQLISELKKLPGVDFTDYYGMRRIFDDHPELR